VGPKKPSREVAKLGGKIRALRRRESISQAELASRLEVSASYLNLIENDRRPLPALVLFKLARVFSVDLREFVADDDARLVSELLEAFSDPLFEGSALKDADLREFVATSPAVARESLKLYRAFARSRENAEALAQRLAEAGEENAGTETLRSPSEDVNDLIQRHSNHFAELEEAAERVYRDAHLETDNLQQGIARHLARAHGVEVAIVRSTEGRGTLRRYDPERKILHLSELLPTRSRTFQMAHQLGLLDARAALDRLADDEHLASHESRALARAALANYFAGAVLMPYEPFLQAARSERYDVDVIGRRFRVGFEQVCHRFTTLRRRGSEGVAFHMIRIDVAGNISKRFSASGIRIARFAGACPRWNVFAAFLTPGMIRLQVSRMPDGGTFFCLARTIQKDSLGYHDQQPVQAIGLGCRLERAAELVYSDGMDLMSASAATPVGVTCRTCERPDCAQRAFPSLRQPLHIDENVRRLSLYAGAGQE
jgi:predicted transcriptional regulator/DNA-binding XRE family transcriptional regulator